MGREVITTKDLELADAQVKAAGAIAGAPARRKPDTYADRLAKYVPAEVVSVYLFVDGTLRPIGAWIPLQAMLWGMFFLLIALTPFYLLRVQKVKKWKQWVISEASFVVWVFSIGGPFANLAFYKNHDVGHALGSVAVALATFVFPIWGVEK
jgi:hypothetical protein